MIFVTLGTQDKPFTRLLEAVENQIKKGNIKEKVIVQAGQTKYDSKYMEVYDLLSQNDFEKYIKDCSLLITHGGVGNILTGLNYNKKIIAAPRLFKYGEHANDHQVEIIDEFSCKGYIMKLETFSKLDKVIEDSKKFKNKKYKSNNEKFCKNLKNELDKL